MSKSALGQEYTLYDQCKSADFLQLVLFQLAVAEQQGHFGSTIKKPYAQNRETTKDEGHVSAIRKTLHVIQN